MSPLASSRWCPTPEQLMILEELYRSGIRTPNASQIQRITAHLSLYGKIEGKNVFYWFQNHKARDRQKLRRKLIKQLQQQQQQQQNQHQIFHPQFVDQDEFPNHHLLGSYFDSPVVATTMNAGFHQRIPCNDPSCLLPQERTVEGIQSSQLMNYKKTGVHENFQMENSMMKMYGHDWMMMVDHEVGPQNPFCSSSSTSTATARPLRTLQLFPVTSTNLKQDCSDNTSSI